MLSFRARNIGEKSEGLALSIASKKAVRTLIPERINVASRAAYWNSPVWTNRTARGHEVKYAGARG
jgi:hypothetical protein